jgi:glycosyltransferase involved in cell wall biosynthesis
MNPKISVITSTYYRNELLREAIESVLAQEYDPVELIVVDDSGEHHAAPVLQEYDDVQSIVMDEEKGWSTAYTTGIEASTGDYIQLLDDDDYLLDGKLQKTAEVLRQNPEVGLSYCGVIKGEEGCYEPNPEVSGDFLENALRFGTFPLWTGSMLIERDVLMDCLPLAEYAGDTDLKIELALRTEVDYVDECLAYYRQEQNRKWVGLKKFREVKRVVRNQQELYDQYPEIREDLLASWYKRQGFNWLNERRWSPQAIACFLRSASHETGGSDKLKTGILAGASLFGRPGLNTTLNLRNRLGGTQSDARLSKS